MIRSSHTRLAVWSALISGIVLFFFIAGTTIGMYFDFVDILDAEIQETGKWFLSTIEDNEEKIIDLENPLEGNILDDKGNFYVIELRSPDHTLYQRSGEWQKIAEDVRDVMKSTFSVRIDEDDWRIGSVARKGWTVSLGVNLSTIRYEVLETLTTFFIALPGALLAVAIGGWWMGKVALRPIEEITQAAEEITASRLDRRISVSKTDDEIARLIRVLNEMISRLESSFSQAARFSADASHQLRTPITVIQGEIDNAIKSGHFQNGQIDVLVRLLEEVQKLKQIIDSLLILSRSDAGNLRLDSRPVDLSVLVREIIEDARILGERLNLTIDGKIDEHITVTADESLLRQAILNLLDNAVRFNYPNGKIHCDLHESETEIKMTIFNTGQPIPTQHHEHIFDRFYKAHAADESVTYGFGLGLSLALEIIKVHQGTLSLVRSDVDGTEFSITLPTTRHERAES